MHPKVWLSSRETIASLIVSTKCLTVSVSSGVSIAKNGRLSSSGVQSVPLMGRLDSVSLARWFVSAR